MRNQRRSCALKSQRSNISVVDELDTEMRRAEATRASRIELDLDQLEFLDASGVRLLLER
jgi:anti-anti-sigma regulatory factor